MPDMSASSDIDDVVAAVRDVVRRVIGVEDVGEEVSFFSLGGNSVGVIEVIARLKEEHGLIIRARQFLQDATVSAIARSCQRLIEPAEPSSASQALEA